MKRIYVYSIILNAICVLLAFNEYIKYCNKYYKIGKGYALLKKAKQDHTYLVQSQPQWQKYGSINLKSLYSWLYERNIQMTLISESENNDFMNYNVKLICDKEMYEKYLNSNFPFGDLVIYKISEKNNEQMTIVGSIIFSKLVHQQKITTKFQDLTLKLTGIMKTENDWEICLNNLWIKKNQDLPWNIKIIDVKYNNIRIEWETFGGVKQYTIVLNQEIQLKHDYNFNQNKIY